VSTQLQLTNIQYIFYIKQHLSAVTYSDNDTLLVTLLSYNCVVLVSVK
jgi:hypothetical protein